MDCKTQLFIDFILLGRMCENVMQQNISKIAIPKVYTDDLIYIFLCSTFEELCRLYRDPRSPAYQKAFLNATRNAAYLPYIGDIIARLLDKLPNCQESKLFKSSTKQSY